MHLSKKTNKIVSGLIVTAIVFSSIPTCVFAQDDISTTDPTIIESSVENTDEVIVETAVEETVDENVTSIPTDETNSGEEVVEEIEEPPIVETTDETSEITIETTEETIIETTEETIIETTESTIETTEETSSNVPEETTNSIIYATNSDEYFELISNFPDKYIRVIADTTEDLSMITFDYAVYFDGTYILGFENDTTKSIAVNTLSNMGVVYAIDGEMTVCGNGNVPTGTLNPDAKIKVAVIDTGSNNANEYYSVIGDDASDENGHGTDMCNYILNETSNAYIISIKALDSNGLGQMTDVYAAVQLAEELGVDYILMSISIRDMGKFEAFKELIKNTNATVIASAGNNGTDAKKYLPAGIDDVITVGALNENKSLRSSSNYGDCVNYYVVADSTSAAASIALGTIINGRSEDLLTKPEEVIDDPSTNDPSNDPNSTNDVIEVKYITTEQDGELVFTTDAAIYIACRGKIYHDSYFNTSSHYGSGWYCSGTYSRTDDDGNDWYTYDASTPRDPDIFYCMEHDKNAPDEGGGEFVPYYLGGSSDGLKALCAFGPGNGETNNSAFYGWAIQWWKDNGDSIISDSDVNSYSLYVITHFCIDKVVNGSWNSDLPCYSYRSVYQDYIDDLEDVWDDGYFYYDGHRYNINKSSAWASWYYEDDGWSGLQNFVRGGASATRAPENFNFHLTKTISNNTLANYTYNFELWDESNITATLDPTTHQIVRTPTRVAMGTATVPSGATAGSSVDVVWSNIDSDYSSLSGNRLSLIADHNYTIIETTMTGPGGIALETPSGWTRSSNLHGHTTCFSQTMTGAVNTTQNFNVTNSSTTLPKVKIQKSVQSGYTNITTGNSCYSLNNTTYKLYSSVANANANTNALATFTCNASGNCSTTYEVAVGSTYYLKETSAGSGMNVDTRVHTIVINSVTSATIDGTNVTASNNVFTVNLTDTPKTDPLTISLRKVDNFGKPVTGANLNGAVFRIYYYAQDLGTGAAPSTATCWYDVTINTNGTLTLATLQGLTPGGGSNPNYLKNLGNTTNGRFPLGTIRIIEQTAPSGYNKNTQVIRIRLLENGQRIITNEGTGQETRNRWDYSISSDTANLTLDEVPTVGYYSLTKANSISSISVAGYNFELYNISASTPVLIATGVSQNDGRVLWTYKPANYYSNNANHTLLTNTTTYALELATGTSTSPIQYQVRELDKDIKMNNVSFTVSAPTISGTNMTRGTGYYYRNLTVTNGNTTTQTITNNYQFGSLNIRKSDVSGDGQARTFNFTVYYYGNGTSASSTGTVFDTFSLTTNTSGIATKSYTNIPTGWYGVVETNSQTGWTVSYSGNVHVTNGSTGTIDVINRRNPSITTSFADVTSGTKVVSYGTSITLRDTVSYSGLTAGTYYITGTIYDKSTSQPLTINGNTVTGRASFVVPSRTNSYGKEMQQSGTATVNYTLNTTGLEGKTLVCYEDLRTGSYTGTIIASHNNINDTAQTLYVPQVRTTLTDNATASHTVAYNTSTVTITDNVACTNLVVGQAYSISGTLYNKSTGASTGITGSANFTATSASQTVPVTYTINRSQIDNTVLVAYETLKVGNTTVAVHNNINDANQTVYLPRITTVLGSHYGTSDHFGNQDTHYSLQDRISYTNLQPNTVYYVSGTLYNAKTHQIVKDASGNNVTTRGMFTSSASGSGTVTNYFTFDLAVTSDITFVAFEDIIIKNGDTDVIVAVHRDFDDLNQSVYIPDLSTTFYDKDLTAQPDIARNATNITLCDDVVVTNLVPGQSYTLVSTIMVKGDTPTALTQNGQTFTKTYTFTADNTGKANPTIEFTGIDATKLGGQTLVCYETLRSGNYVLVVHNDINDGAQTVYIPTIETTLLNTNTNSHIVPSTGSVTLTDTITYTNLVPNKTYTITGKLVYTDGTTVPNSSKTSTFTPTSANGTTSVSYTINTSNMGGRTIVAYEEISINNVTIVAHNNINDAAQTVYAPSISTQLVSTATNSHVAPATGTTTLRDTVTYSNLVPNTQYTISGKLVNKANGNTIGSVVTKTFTATAASGSVYLDFSINTANYAGQTIVCYESLLYGTVEIANHNDINDGAQTIYVPNIGTQFYDTNLSASIDSVRSLNSVSLTDTVTYSNLVPNVEYKLTATIMVKEDNDYLRNSQGNPITVTKTFTPTSANGSTTVTFTGINTLAFKGKTLVCYETLAYGNTNLVVHNNINDNDQTVHIPDIATTLVSTTTNSHLVPAVGTTTLRDTITYTNLVPGQSYTLSGKLVYSDGTDVPGATATKTFTPTTANGSTTMDFSINTANINGKTIVAYESLIVGSVTLATHNNLNDANQTVYIPKIRTEMLDSTTNTHITANSNSVTLIDTVTYENLIPNTSYTLTGTLVDYDTGLAIKNAQGNDIIVTKTINPTSANGSETISFTIDSSLVAGKTLIAFESLKLNNVEIANHNELDDADQTIYVPNIATTFYDKNLANYKDVAECATNVTLVDTVEYTNLIPNETYTLTATIMVKEDNALLKNAAGNTITVTKTFKPTSANGTVDVEFTGLDTTLYEGKTFVCYETLKYGTFTLVVHEDINDVDQTVHIPKIRTTLTDNATITHVAMDGTATVTDRVAYENLVPGIEYTISGILVDKNTGAETTVVSSKTFTPTSYNGTVEVVYTINRSQIDDVVLVAYEVLKLDNVTIAKHTDLNDNAQTIYLPKIRTTLVGDLGTVRVEGQKTYYELTDRVDYTNLMPNTVYTVSGIIMDKSTGQPLLDVSGNTITGTAMFMSSASGSGRASVDFQFNANITDSTTLVCYENLIYTNANKVDIIIANHSDINDVDQSVFIPDISTSFYDKDLTTDKDTARRMNDITLVDTVTYTNIYPGVEYTLDATVMIKGDVPTVLTDASGNPVKVTKTFTPTSTDGTIDVEFTHIDATKLAGQTLVCYETLRFSNFILVVHADINDAAQTVHIPDIGTTLTSDDTNDHIAPAIGTVTLTDNVEYKNLIPGKTYTLAGKLVYTKDGSTVAGSAVTKTFVPTTANGIEPMVFTIDASKLQGETIVAFEDLKVSDITIATHADIDDEEQTVYIPEIGTTLVDSETNIHLAAQKSSITLIDTVKYENLIPGSYTMTGTLYDATTGQALKNAAGTAITASKNFTVTDTNKNGTIDITFTIDSSIYGGDITIVAYEKLFYSGVEIANHEDITDEDQTVYVPDIHTTFYDSNLADDKDTAASAESITLIDTVNYENLVPDIEYTLTATVMIKGTSPIALKDKNGNDVTITKTFTPTTANGSIDVVFNNVDTTLCAGKTLVCYETLTYDNVDLVIHADINDNDQTVHVPDLATTLVSVDTNDHIVPAIGTVELTDTVKYTNLIIGKEYTISGKLVFADTGADVGSTATTTFTAQSVDGTVELTFTINAEDLKGETVVAFEDLYIGEKKIATHSDLNDKDQTTYIPDIHTTLVDKNTKDHITSKTDSVTLVDTVAYENLIPGKEYVVTGTLMIKGDTPEILKDAQGNDVVVSKTFTPDSANGTVDVEFTIDTSTLGNKTLVAYETLSYNNVDIAIHADINDVEQTVHVPDVETTFYDRDLSTDKDTAQSYDNITLVDEVNYSNLIPNKEYTLTGTIMIKDTNKPLTDAEGNIITVTEKFTPTTPDGSINIEFTGINGKMLEGSTTVAFETLTYNNVNIVVHADIEDEDQTVHFPMIRTTLVSDDTLDHVLPVGEVVTLTDTVEYKNLIVGKEYIIKGTLVFVDDQTLVTNGTGETTFTPNSENGSIDVTFTINTSDLKNKTIVCYEELFIDTKSIASHKDLTDENQTVHIPEIHTTLLDEATDKHISAQGMVTVIDSVSCNNLIIGKEYTLDGILMNKKTGEKLTNADGSYVTATLTWTAKEKDEIQKLTFTFDSALLEDGTGAIVAFESLKHNNIEITTHNDLTDFDQSVYVPSVYTELFDEAFVDTPEIRALTRNFTEVNLVDHVYVKNLTPGYTYTIHSGLYIRESSVANMAITDPNDPMYQQMVPFLDANGDQYETTITFTLDDNDTIIKNKEVDPDTGAISGMVEIKYTIDATLLSGKHVVAFESIDIEGTNGKSIVLVSHADPTNDFETVSIPEIGTTAKDKVDGDKIFDGTKNEQTVVDTIAYTGLIPGHEYVATGKLVVKKDYAEGEEYEYVTDKNGNIVSVSVPFTPDATNSTIDPETGAASGTIDVEIPFDASKYAGKYVVAFETVTYKGIEVAVHADIEDETQTTYVDLILHVKIAKMDGKNVNYVLKNAEITIFAVQLDAEGNPITDAQGNIIYTVAKDINGKDCVGVTDESGELEFRILYAENIKYYAKETKAPRGYYLNEDYFEIIPTEERESLGVCLIPITIVDFAIPPKTGDSMNIGYFATLAILSSLGICGALYFIYKKKKSEENC